MYTLGEIGAPFIRINGWPGFWERSIAEIVVANTEQEKITRKIFEELDWQYRVVPDVPGMISARIIAMIINEAYYTLEEEVSTKAEIDIAMKLGTNYPYGPFEWSEQIGVKHIYELLTALSKTDRRYVVSTALEKEVNERVVPNELEL